MHIRHFVVLLAFVAYASGAAAASLIVPPFPKTVVEGDTGQTRVNVDVKIWPETTTVTLTVVATSGIATVGHDFLPLSETLTFLPGETAKVVKLTILGDILTEWTEPVFLQVQEGNSYRGWIPIEILDDDPRPSAYIRDIRVTEGASFAQFRVIPQRQPGKVDARIDYTTVNGTAIAGQDYQATTASLFIPAGSNSADIFIPLIADERPEADETFTLRILHSVGIDAGPGTIKATIVDDDAPPPPFRIDAPAVYEGDSGTTPVEITVSLATASSSPVTVTVQTTGGGSATGDVDYARFAKSVTFPPGVTARTVEATVFGDTLVEGEETFWVGVLVDGVVRASERIRIRDDDDPRPLVSIGDVELRETDGAAGKAAFAVTLSKPATMLVRVAYETVADTASLLDFTHAAGVLLFEPGQTSKVVTVDVTGDRVREETETFRVELSNPDGLLIGDGSAVCTILDNDGTGRRRAARH